MPDNSAASSFSLPTPLLVAVLIAVAVLLAILVWIAYKGRPFAAGDVFRASRFSRGNRIFPTQVLISPTTVVHYTPQWIGHLEHSIHMAHVASVSVQTKVLFSDVYIETSGGTTPVHCRGHRKGDAVRMKHLIEQYQTLYYRQSSNQPASPGTSVTTAPGPPRPS